MAVHRTTETKAAKPRRPERQHAAPRRNPYRVAKLAPDHVGDRILARVRKLKLQYEDGDIAQETLSEHTDGYRKTRSQTRVLSGSSSNHQATEASGSISSLRATPSYVEGDIISTKRKRKDVRYYEDESDEEGNMDGLSDHYARQDPGSGEDSDEEAEDDDEKEEIQTPASPDVRFKHTPQKSKPRKARKNGKAVTISKTAATTVSQEERVIKTVKQDWTDPRIEHSIWVQILGYAAGGGDNGAFDGNWLLHTARSCKTLADPAITVLYRCPPLPDEAKAAGLVALLARSPQQTAFKYRPKIESLHIDVTLIKLSSSRCVSLLGLIQNLPRLRELLFFHPTDAPPYRNLDDHIRWEYPPDIFRALEVSPTANEEAGDKMSMTVLRSWQWSSRLLGSTPRTSLERIMELHPKPIFANLRKVRFINYQLPSLKSKDPEDPAILAEDKACRRLMADCISPLQNLEHLAFESSTVVNSYLLPLLPKKLKHLELISCWDVHAEDFGDFLLSHGYQLEYLTLHHNQSLNLAFLPVLGVACPNLKELRMNFLCYAHHDGYNDSDPNYDFILLADQVPRWPSSMELIELENIRRWSTEAAEMFLQSFIGSASELLKLRSLSIKAMLDIPWRQRSEFRKSWQERLETVFLRPFVPPKPFRTLQNPPVAAVLPVPNKKRKIEKGVKPSRRSGRVVIKPSRPSSRASSASRDLRVAGGSRRKSYREPDTDDDEFDSGRDIGNRSIADSVSDSGRSARVTPSPEKPFIQGLCNVVNFVIDNSKPAERQYAMEDFLNSDNGEETDGEWYDDYDD